MTSPTSLSRIRLGMALVIGLAIGVPAGIGIVTLWYGEAFSYLGSAP